MSHFDNYNISAIKTEKLSRWGKLPIGPFVFVKVDKIPSLEGLVFERDRYLDKKIIQPEYLYFEDTPRNKLCVERIEYINSQIAELELERRKVAELMTKLKI